MIASRSCERAMFPGAGIHSTTSESAFFAGENSRDDKWTFAGYREGNSNCVALRWDAHRRRISGGMQRYQLLPIQPTSVGGAFCLTKGSLAHPNQHCECRPVGYDWGKSGRAYGGISA